MQGTAMGIDIGATSVSIVLLGADGAVVASASRRHHGNPQQTLDATLRDLPAHGHVPIGATGSGRHFVKRSERVTYTDSVQSVVTAVRLRYEGVRNIIDIGGASVTLVRLSSSGEFRGYSTNSQCAAGTGSFLDEQAERLGLRYEEMGELSGIQEPPAVATRCAVFAKSDLIHLQQVGATQAEMWSGLCRGMARTALQTLLQGKPLDGKTILCGGVARNAEVVRWIRELAGTEIVCDPEPHLLGAVGGALLAVERTASQARSNWREQLGAPVQGAATRRSLPIVDNGPRFECKPLRLVKTHYPDFNTQEVFVDDRGSEVRISRWPEGGGALRGTVGIDIGSTSTKLCLIDDTADVVIDIYRKTAGDPVGATRALFDALQKTARDRNTTLEIEGCGTTGSGRKLVGGVVGADAVVNEISAHVAGAMHVDPELDTIFEIGGQDAKYMRCKNGEIVDANMNYVCAAGTGSFVEEQARKLGVPLHQVGPMTLGVIPPPSSDRCTVFMEHDVHTLIRSGHPPAEALAAVMRSVVQNYLNKVVGNRPYSSTKIGFQGATARNPGLVAAFETLLDVEMVVTPFCHVMGAWGVALLTQERMRRAETESTFLGLDLSDRRVELRRTRCELCTNDCEITHAHVEGCENVPSWGYLCGRDPLAKQVRVLQEADLFKKRDRWLRHSGKNRAAQAPVPRRLSAALDPANVLRVGKKLMVDWAGRVPVVSSNNGKGRPKARRPVGVVPRALSTYSNFPMWQRLLIELGAKVVLTDETRRSTREKGAELIGAEFCFPIKVAHGHVAEAVQMAGADFVFLPHFVAETSTPGMSNSYLCPYVQSLPSVMRSALRVSDQENIPLLSPVVDRRMSWERQVKDLHAVLGPALGVTRAQVDRAFAVAIAAQERFLRKCVDAGRETLAAIDRSVVDGEDPRPGIVLIGRPYNLNDPGLNLDLPTKIAQLGYRVIPLDFLPFEPHLIDPLYSNTFWHYGQRILSALEQVRRNPNLFAIYFSNFNCGPDSFLLSYASEIMGDKPMLALELDEHGSDGGYITRVEAFLDVVHAHFEPGERREVDGSPRRKHAPAPDVLQGRRIWVPRMHPVTSDVFAAAFRGEGYDAVALPMESRADLDVGQHATRGCECLPMRTTIGGFLNALDHAQAERASGGPDGKVAVDGKVVVDGKVAIGGDGKGGNGAGKLGHTLFMPTAKGPCRFGQYATLDRIAFDRAGRADVGILSPSSENAYAGLSEKLRRQLWKALVVSDLLYKMTLRVRPYEAQAGSADGELQRWTQRAIEAFESNADLSAVLQSAGRAFLRIPTRSERRPLVGIVGEIYVRNNPFCNEDVVRVIEAAGGEAWISPIGEWMLFTAAEDVRKFVDLPKTLGGGLEHAKRLLKSRYLHTYERKYFLAAGSVIRDRPEPDMNATLNDATAYLPFSMGGETLLSMGRAVQFARQGASMIVNCSPFGCMAGTMAAALFAGFEEQWGIPVANLFYEGTGDVNRRLEVFIANLPQRTSRWSQAPSADISLRQALSVGALLDRARALRARAGRSFGARPS